MTSYFSQIQYVPDPITGERINIGIVVVDPTGSRFQFVQDWKRAATFGGGQDIGFLKEFADEATTNGAAWLAKGSLASTETLTKSLGRWQNKIQFSKPLPSVKGYAELLEDLAPRFLHLTEVEPATPHRGRGREKAILTATKSLAAAMRERYGHAPRGILQRDLDLAGKIESHKIDVGLKNGELYGGAFAVSFETNSPRSQERDTDAIAFALEDLRTRHDDLAVIVLPPHPVTPTYQRSRRIFKALDVRTLAEKQLPAWASALVEKLPKDIRAIQEPA
jgi:hypothetical protein